MAFTDTGLRIVTSAADVILAPLAAGQSCRAGDLLGKSPTGDMSLRQAISTSDEIPAFAVALEDGSPGQFIHITTFCVVEGFTGGGTPGVALYLGATAGKYTVTAGGHIQQWVGWLTTATAGMVDLRRTIAGYMGNEFHAAAAIVGSKLSEQATLQVAKTRLFDVSAGAAAFDDIIMVAHSAVTIHKARVIYTTETTGVIAAATVQVGTTVGGVGLVAAAALENAKPVGSYTELTLVSDAVAPTTMIAVRATLLAAGAGEFYVQIEYTVND